MSTPTNFAHAVGGDLGLASVGRQPAASGDLFFLQPLTLEEARAAFRECQISYAATREKFKQRAATQAEVDEAETVLMIAENNFIEAMRREPFASRKGAK